MTLGRNARTFAFSTALLASFGSFAALSPSAHAQPAPAAPPTLSTPSASVAPETAPASPPVSVQVAPTAPVAPAPAPAVPVQSTPAQLPRSAQSPQSAEPNDAADLARLRGLATRGASPFADARWAIGLTGLGASAVATPVGATMIARDGSSLGAAVTLGTGIGAGIGSLIVLSGVLVSFNPYSQINESIDREKTAGKSDGVALAAGEKAFEKAATEARDARRATGIVGIGLGVIGLGAGAVAGIADFTTPRFTRRDQDGIAAAFTIYGVLASVSGVAALFAEAPIESAWNGYSAGKGSRRTGALKLTGFGAAPLPEGGATLGLGGTF